MTYFILPVGSPAVLAFCLAGWFLLINSMTVAAFRIDRRRAKADEWRVPKQTLLMLATLGGWPGVKLTQLISRRKLHRRPFRLMLDLSILPMVCLAIFLAAHHVFRQEVGAIATKSIPAHAASATAQPEVSNLTKISATNGFL